MAAGRYPADIGTIVDYRSVTFIGGSSRKEYIVTVAEDTTSGYMAVGTWGRVGSANQHKIYARNTDLDGAVTAANRLLDDKVKRGYVSAAHGGVVKRFSTAALQAPGTTDGDLTGGTPADDALGAIVPVACSLADALFA